MKKNKIFGLEDWELDKNHPDSARSVQLRIFIKYPDYKDLLQFEPRERNKRIAIERKRKIADLLETGFLHDYRLIGNKRSPNGIETKIAFPLLSKVEKLGFVKCIFIERIDHARKIRKAVAAKFFCIRMTVAIEVEGITKGLQSYEERFVLVKAKSVEQAYAKIEKAKIDYAEPYLNPYGNLVRWRIESLDDCYETFIEGFDDLNKPEGAEVFSVLKKRKLTPERVWNGKLDDL